MEVTDLKGLKRLMKGDASRKFEFVEDDHENLQYDEMTFSFTGGNNGLPKRDNASGTYNTFNNAASHKAAAMQG